MIKPNGLSKKTFHKGLQQLRSIKMSSGIQVRLYEGLRAPCSDIIEFLDSLEFVPAQHDPRWAQVYAKLTNEDFWVAVSSQNGKILGVSTFTIFNGPFGAILHANPYMGYGGCSCTPGRESEVIHSVMETLLDHAQKLGCITASVATPPFSEQLVDLYKSALKPDYCYENFYQYHYLDQHPLEGLKKKRRSAFRSEIKRAESSGIKISRAVDSSEVEAWLDIYEARYAQIGARVLPRAFQIMLWDTFAPVGKTELHLARQGGQLLGGTLFLIGRGIVDYFSTAFSTESMNLYPGTLILHNAFTRFMKLGIKRFNWQSSPSRDSGVYNYKKRWGALEGQHLILTRILGDPAVFTTRPLSEVRDAYGAHFVLPYDLWKSR